MTIPAPRPGRPPAAKNRLKFKKVATLPFHVEVPLLRVPHPGMESEKQTGLYVPVIPLAYSGSKTLVLVAAIPPGMGSRWVKSQSLAVPFDMDLTLLPRSEPGALADWITRQVSRECFEILGGEGDPVDHARWYRPPALCPECATTRTRWAATGTLKFNRVPICPWCVSCAHACECGTPPFFVNVNLSCANPEPEGTFTGHPCRGYCRYCHNCLCRGACMCCTTIMCALSEVCRPWGRAAYDLALESGTEPIHDPEKVAAIQPAIIVHLPDWKAPQ